MDSKKLKCVIKLGSVEISCLIAELDERASIKILSSSTIQSKGIHNGVVVNPSEATKAIRSCLSDAETKANVILKKINIVLEVPEFICTRFSKFPVGQKPHFLMFQRIWSHNFFDRRKQGS